MNMIRLGVLGCSLLALSSTACTGPNWSSALPANPRQVALAFNDPVDIGPALEFNAAAVPTFKAPDKLRPCCAFGMDIRGELGTMKVPIYKVPNIVSIETIGPHGYDNGKMAGEKNGLVYTCRGGFIDVAHIRDNGDRMLFLATQIARRLPDAFSFDLPDEGTTRRVVVKALPEGMLARYGRWNIVTTIAQWVNFQYSVWHEIVTWYGWQSLPGFSEKVSAFSPEDLFSNVVGEKIAAGIITNREIRSSEEYDQAMDAWIPEALRRLGAVSVAEGRAAMKSVDGLWWDSTKAAPDNKLVTRRDTNIGTSHAGWLVSEAVAPEKLAPELRQMCAREPPPLTLDVPDHLGDKKIADLVTLEFQFKGWLPESTFPLPARKGVTLTQADFPAIMEGVRRDGARDMGAGFDRPVPRSPGDKPVERLTGNP